MSKILSLFFIIMILIISSNITKANNDLKIISREEWWADEQYRYSNSAYWAEILATRAANSAAWSERWAWYSQEKKDSLTAQSKRDNAKFNSMNKYLTTNFYDDIKIADRQSYEWENKIYWEHLRTNYVKNIVIHHTYTDYPSSAEWIKKIYEYHASSRQWWDIGYHYIIWYDGEVYEWKSGWDYVVGSHDTWNNRSTVWISIMWNYDEHHLKETQYESLKKLVSHLTEKYWIDLNNKIPYHKECFWTLCADSLETKYFFPIVWHQDWKATSCPWEHIYEDTIPRLLKELQPETKWYKQVSYWQITKEKNDFQTRINTMNWTKVKKYLSEMSETQKETIMDSMKQMSEKEIWWKNKILLERLLEETRWIIPQIISVRKYFTFTKSLSVWSENQEVIKLEEIMQKLNYFDSNPDNIFDEETKASLTKLLRTECDWPETTKWILWNQAKACLYSLDIRIDVE